MPLHPGRLALALAALLAFASVYALATPSVYAREAAAWRVQVVVQDWVDLVLLVPALVAGAVGLRRGSRAGAFLLGGALMYAVYNLVIYAFALHFNRLFLAYCASLGLAVYALVGLLAGLARQDVAAWFRPDAARRFPAALLVALAAAFALLWLAEVVGAIADDAPPASLEGTGLLSNPVHALDLSVTLPTLALAGVWLWRGRPAGFLLAPMALVFALLTDVAIVAILVASRAQGLEGEPAVAAAIGAVAVPTAGALVALLRGLRRPGNGAAGSPTTHRPGGHDGR